MKRKRSSRRRQQGQKHQQALEHGERNSNCFCGLDVEPAPYVRLLWEMQDQAIYVVYHGEGRCTYTAIGLDSDRFYRSHIEKILSENKDGVNNAIQNNDGKCDKCDRQWSHMELKQ